MTSDKKRFAGQSLPWLAFAILVLAPEYGHGQVSDAITRQKVDQLFLRDESLRTSIQGQRIDRQAEISRLEGRITKLEQSARQSAQSIDSSRLISLLFALEAGFKANDVAANGEPQSFSSAEEEHKSRTASTVRMESEVDVRRQEMLKFIAEDYVAGLKSQMLEARITLMEEAALLMSLQRLGSKGLATKPQLDLQRLKRDSAESRYARLKQQQTGLRELFPSLFASDLPPPEEEQKQSSEDTDTESRGPGKVAEDSDKVSPTDTR